MRFIVLIGFLIAIFTLISAQTSDDFEAWEFVSQCVAEPTAPPADWGFDGAVLLTGEFGIHAIDANIATPYVVAFLRDVVPGGISAGLSPDGQYYATVRGIEDRNQPINARVWDIFELHLYGMSATGGDIVFPLEQDYEYGVGLDRRLYMRWFDDQNLLYTIEEGVSNGLWVNDVEPAIINPFEPDDPIREWANQVNPMQNRSAFFPAPDWERAILNTTEAVFDPAEWQIVDIESGDVIAEPDLADFIEPVWSPDSSQFVAEIEQETDDDFVYQVALFDADGDQTDVLLTLASGERLMTAFESDVRHVRWSDDGRYLAFITTTLSFPTNITLYIADTETRTVTDTCIYTEDGIAWSPDSTQIALFPRLVYEPRQELLIFDLEDWAQYGTGRFHEGRIIGWRE